MSKTAIITGASKGIGKEVALRLALLGYNLVLVARNQNKLDEVLSEVLMLKVRATTIAVDLTTEGAISQIIEKALSEFSRIDVLINNAGIATLGSVLDTSEAQWDNIMKLNAKVPFFLCQAAIPFLEKSERGTIINISSVVGRKGYVNQAAYSSSKHALAGFTKVLSQEVRPLGIRVHLIAPGGVATEMVTTMRPDIDPKKLIQPEEIADAVEYLLSFKGNAIIDEINMRRFDSPLL